MDSLLPSALLLSALGAGGPCRAEEPGPPPAPPSLRESIDSARARLAGNLFGLQVSAFGDAASGYGGDGKRDFRFGAAEVDVAGDITQDVQLGMAVVKNPDATQLTVGFLDYHPFGGQIAPRGQLSVERGFHVQVGRFDVPFGNDLQFYASKDSVSISRPLTTTEIMDGGYNDSGLRILGNTGTVNFNTYLLRGFEPGRLVGGRIGLTPFGDPFSLSGTREPKVAEIGVSYFYDGTSRWRKRQTGFALDGDGRLGRCYLRAEYVARTLEPAAGSPDPTTRRGWHLTQETALQDLVAWPTTLFVRLDRVAVAAAPLPEGRDTRAGAGVSTTAGGVLQLKLEGDHYLAAAPGTQAAPGYRSWQWFAQLVAVF